jgi:transposase
MDTGVKRTQRDYTLAFKLAVVEQVEKGQMSYKQAQERYGIQGRSTVLVWLRRHGRQGWAEQDKGKAMPIDSKVAMTPEQQIKALEVQLKEANEKARLFEAMLDVLSQDYGVRVVKKPLGKSSRAGSYKASGGIPICSRRASARSRPQARSRYGWLTSRICRFRANMCI